MLLWLMVALMLVATLATLLLPLFWGRDHIETREAYDANVFKDQLKAIDEELAEGLIESEDADAARIEISRKLLAAAAEADARPRIRASGRESSRLVMYALAVALPVAALTLYNILGSPGLGDLPLQARQQEEPQKERLAELIARAEAKLAEHPEDGRGWDIMAPVYLRHGMYDKAIGAYRNAVRLLGPSGDRLTGLVDAMVFASDGIVTEEALSVVQQAIKVAPEEPKPQFWLALYNEQHGKAEEAMKGYTQLLESSASDMPWRETVAGRLNELRKQKGLPEIQIAGLPPAAAPAEGAGPTAADVQRAGQMSAGDRQAMIESMVTRLAERLKTQGGDLATWMKLVNAYGVLGRKAEALDAIKLAKANLKSDGAAVAQLDQLAQQLSEGGAATTAPSAAAPSAAAPGPSAEDVRRAGEMSAGDQQAMINSMVTRLADRLSKEGGDLASWTRLINAYTVLGKKAEAQDAIKRAKDNLKADGAAVAQLTELAKRLGLDG
jgi:cytochrome c-type biogenesis protein CcmH